MRYDGRRSSAMTKPAKIALAIASIWPFIWMLIFLLFFFGMIFFISSHPRMNDRHEGMPLPIMLLFAGHLFTILFMFALTAFYVVYLFFERIANGGQKGTLGRRAVFRQRLRLPGLLVFVYLERTGATRLNASPTLKDKG
jgi:hypothetical protein